MSNTITVTKASQPLPEVTVDGPLDGKVFGLNSFYITAKATVCWLVLRHLGKTEFSNIDLKELSSTNKVSLV